MVNAALLYGRGDELRCQRCGDLIAVLQIDVPKGTRLYGWWFHAKKGQGPWKNGEPARCRVCQTAWLNDQANQILADVARVERYQE